MASIRLTLNGNVTATGGENADERGFDYSYRSGIYDYSWTEVGSFGTGAFSKQLTGLEFDRTLYFRAKAHNSAGWGYGSQESVTTPLPGAFPKIRPVPREVVVLLVDYSRLKMANPAVAKSLKTERA